MLNRRNSTLDVSRKLVRVLPLAFVVMLALALQGCISVGPDYQPPAGEPPLQWLSQVSDGGSAELDPSRLADWWQQLNDPLLTELITQAVDGNWELEIGQQRVREARARRAVSAADRWPTLGSSSSVRQSRVDPPQTASTTTKLYDSSLDARWELGLFGGKRRALEAANADWQASIEDHADLLVSVVAEVALNYVDLRTLQGRLTITRRNLASQAETLDITGWRYQAGLTTQVDVEQARQNLEQTRAQIPLLITAQQRALNRIATLIGGYPGTMRARLSVDQPIPTASLAIALGLPADALRRRPDIRAAERRLAARSARIGVATAARYPDLSLVGLVGLESLTSKPLFSSNTLLTTALADVGLVLFDAGRIRQNIEIQNAAQAQALASYESTVRLALEEVENSLVAFSQEQLRRQSLARATRAAELAGELIRSQYSSGLVDFQRVLSAERSLLNLQDQLASSDGQITANVIRLYKAAGGGWKKLQPSTPDQENTHMTEVKP